TSFSRDWSSDVCSSDLAAECCELFFVREEPIASLQQLARRGGPTSQVRAHGVAGQHRGLLKPGGGQRLPVGSHRAHEGPAFEAEIGRASCRERGWGRTG